MPPGRLAPLADLGRMPRASPAGTPREPQANRVEMLPASLVLILRSRVRRAIKGTQANRARTPRENVGLPGAGSSRLLVTQTATCE